MPYIYLISTIFCVASSSIFGGFYSRRTADKKDASALFGLLELGTVFLLWAVLYATGFSFDVKVLPYSLFFAIFFAMGKIGKIFALRNGPVLLTALMIQAALIAATLWWIVKGDADMTWRVGIGLVLISLALWLCLYNGKKEEGKKISWKWLFFSLLAFVGNAGCTIVQKTQQDVFQKQHGNMLMFFATMMAFVLGLVIYIKSDRTDSKEILKEQSGLPVLAGIGNVAMNYLVMLMVGLLSSSLVYPTLAVGGLIVTTLFSLFAFKEKMRWWQWIGVAIGILATGLLS